MGNTKSLCADGRKPRLLDLFCGGGGAGTGYARAGFEVVGVDIRPQPNYPFEFHQADALAFLHNCPQPGFDAIHASPPCQGYTVLRHAPGAKGTAPLLIDDVRRHLERTGLPWVIENVEQAAWSMREPVTLCGSMFALGAQGHELRRHRLFESSFSLDVPECSHTDRPVIGVYGGHARRRAASHGGRGTQDEWVGGHRRAAAGAMGIDWMTLVEMSEAIPPAYTEYVGGQILAHLSEQEASVAA